MSKKQSNQLSSTYFSVSSQGFGVLDTQVYVRVNEINPDIVELTVGSVRIVTDRGNWAAIFRAFTEQLGTDLEIALPGHKIQMVRS